MKKWGALTLSFHSLSPPSFFPPPLPWSGAPGVLTPEIFYLFLFCCSWVLEHIGATKGWFLVKGFVVRNFWKIIWRAWWWWWWWYMFPPSILHSPASDSLSPSLPCVSASPTIYTTRYLENNRIYKQYKTIQKSMHRWTDRVEARTHAYESCGTHCLTTLNQLSQLTP